MQESTQWEIAILFYVSGWADFMIVGRHCTGHELELLEEKLEKTALENLEICKALPLTFPPLCLKILLCMIAISLIVQKLAIFFMYITYVLL